MLRLLLVPNNSSQAEDLSDGPNTVVRVTIGRPPVLGQTSIGRIVDDLHRPAELTEQLLVGESGHVRMGPRMHGDVTLEFLVGPQELRRVVQDVDTNHEMGSRGIVLLQEIVQRVGGLQDAMLAHRGGKYTKISTHPGNRTIVKADTEHTVGSVPEITRVATLVGGRANLLSKRIFVTVCRVTASGRGRREVWNVASLDSSIQRIHPCLRQFCRVRLGIRILGAPFCGDVNSKSRAAFR